MRSTVTKLFFSLLFVSAAMSFNVANASEPTVEEFNAAFVEANEARKMSGSLGHEWRDTVKILRAAQKAAEGGDLGSSNETCCSGQISERRGNCTGEQRTKSVERPSDSIVQFNFDFFDSKSTVI